MIRTLTSIAELYGISSSGAVSWGDVVAEQKCPFLERKCRKNRKSEPEVTIGTCTMMYGLQRKPLMTCPFRLLERSQIFLDCVHLLKLHEPGNEFRIVPELSIPGGSVDYCLVSVRGGKPKDFVGIELQTLDTTGTVWPERQRFLQSQGVYVRGDDAGSHKSFGINWKMTAKTTLVQLHHKVGTFQGLSKHLVLVLQAPLLDYMRKEFDFGHVKGVRDGDPMHFHSYDLRQHGSTYRLEFDDRLSTDANGIATCLGLQATTNVELVSVLRQIEDKLSRSVLLSPSSVVPISSTADAVADDPG